MSKPLYRVTRRQDDGTWVPVRSYKAGARETTYGDYVTAARALSGFKGSRRRGPYRVESTSTEWLPSYE